MAGLPLLRGIESSWSPRSSSATFPVTGRRWLAVGTTQLSFTLPASPSIGAEFIVTALDADHLILPNGNTINGRVADLTAGDNILVPRGATAYLVTVSTNTLEVI